MEMKIITKDVKKLTGKFIVQINRNEADAEINESNWGFFQEKRISFVCGLKWVGFYYEHASFETEDQFVTYFNDYVSPKTKPENIEERKNERFHRLLTSKEIDFVCKKMKETNYYS